MIGSKLCDGDFSPTELSVNEFSLCFGELAIELDVTDASMTTLGIVGCILSIFR